MKKRVGEPWMPASAYAKQLAGLGINLLVASISDALAFQRQVLQATVEYADEDFAALSGYGSSWCLHADHTYSEHPLYGIARGVQGRGAGAELRVHGCDPDVAVAAARAHGYIVLAGAADKPHGLREAYLLDSDGYCWVPAIPLT